jgi:uncharacterized protein (TIGR02246 family)
MRRSVRALPFIVGVCGLAASALLGCGGSGEPSEADLTMARSISPAFVRAMESKDSEALASFYAEEGTLMPPGAPPIQGRAAIQAFWERMVHTAIKKVALNPQDLRMSGDLSYEVGTYDIDLALPDGTAASEQGKYIVLMKKQADGSWKMTHDMWSSNTPAPVPPAPARP